ncbi:phage holin family protein [Escherichia coli]
MTFYVHIVMLSLLGGVYSYLSGLCENRYESSCKKLLAECISAVLAGFIGMYLAEYT